MLTHVVMQTVLIFGNIACFALAGLDESNCGKTKGCYMPEPGLTLSYQIISDSYMDIEFSADVNTTDHYVTASFGTGTNNSPIVECTSVDNFPPTMRVSHGNVPVQLERPNEPTPPQKYLLNVSTSFSNGTMYCRARVLLNKGQNGPGIFTYDPAAMYTITITEGPIQQGKRTVSKTFTSSPLSLNTPAAVPGKHQYSLDVQTRRKLVKAHSILMVLAWFFFVPSGFVFARFLRNTWSGVKSCGVSVWHQVHRVCNFIGIILMIASFVCILTCKDWRWTGPGSTSHYYTKVHTMVGLIGLILAWLQPIGSLFRCPPNHHQRPVFNWGHRFCGVAAFALATASTAITALEFKIWQERALQLVLVLSPSVILIVLIVLFIFLDLAEEPEKKSDGSMQALRISLVFFALGLLMAVSIWMSVLLANGYKNAVG